MDFSQLSPDEVQLLADALKEYQGGGDDQTVEDEKFASLCQAVEMCQQKISAMDEEIDMILKLLQDEIMEPIRAGVEENRRKSGIAELSEKYGEKFGPHKEFYGTISGGADIFEKLFDEIEGERSKVPEWNEESEGGLIESLLKGLEERRAALKDVESKGSEKPEAVEVTEVKAEPNEKEDLKKLVKKMKAQRLPGMGM
jgi:hypothetical protein